nr:ribonuclease H-like domain-containing protein [Tanacetum cinerariifolium]
MWLFHCKYLANDTLSLYKAHLVANGSMQLKGIDVDDTFSPFVKSGTIQAVLSLATFKQASQAWFQRFAAYITRVGFTHSRYDSLFIYGKWADTTYLLLYVDDIIITTSSMVLLQQIIASLHQEFSMKDLVSLNYFMGIFVTRDSSRMFLSQRKYAAEILERAHMVNCNPSRTHVDTDSKLRDDGDLVSDPTLYRSLAGYLQYLIFTRPDISYAVHQSIVVLSMLLLRLLVEETTTVEIDPYLGGAVCFVLAARTGRIPLYPSLRAFEASGHGALWMHLWDEMIWGRHVSWERASEKDEWKVGWIRVLLLKGRVDNKCLGAGEIIRNLAWQLIAFAAMADASSVFDSSVEIKRLTVAKSLSLVNEDVSVPMNIFWQAPEYIFLGPPPRREDFYFGGSREGGRDGGRSLDNRI